MLDFWLVYSLKFMPISLFFNFPQLLLEILHYGGNWNYFLRLVFWKKTSKTSFCHFLTWFPFFRDLIFWGNGLLKSLSQKPSSIKSGGGPFFQMFSHPSVPKSWFLCVDWQFLENSWKFLWILIFSFPIFSAIGQWKMIHCGVIDILLRENLS